MRTTGFVKKAVALTLTAAMVITMVSSDAAKAAKKPKLNIKSKEISKGDKVKLKVKNANKKAKVTWKASGKKVVKLAAKKGLTNTVTALKEGKSTITATYKAGSKKTPLVCNIRVKAKAENDAPAATEPVVVPQVTLPPVLVTNAPVVNDPQITEVPKVTPATTSEVKPTSVPTVKPTPAPTKIPDTYASEVSEPLDYTSRRDTDSNKGTSEVSGGALVFKGESTSTVINLPGCSKEDDEYAPKDAYIIVYVKGNYTGENGFALEAGSAEGSCLVPDDTMVNDKKQLVFPADHEKGEFSEVYFGKCDNSLRELAIKSLNGKPASGVELKEIRVQFCGFEPRFTDKDELIIPGKEPFEGYMGIFKIPFAEDKADGDVVGTEVMINDCSDGHRNGSLNLFAPGRNYTDEDGKNIQKEPYFSVALFGDLVLKDSMDNLPQIEKTAYAAKINKELTIDKSGDAALDEVWDSIAPVKITDFTLFDAEWENAKQTITEAEVKFAWTAKNLYILVKVVDPEFENESATGENFQSDSLEIYFDETRNRDEEGNVIPDYDSDAFQYRLAYNSTGGDGEGGRNYAESGYKVESTTKFFKVN